MPPYTGVLLVAKLREAIQINWNGLYKHKADSGEPSRVDWIDSVGYKKLNLGKKVSKSANCDWIPMADADVGQDRIRLL